MKNKSIIWSMLTIMMVAVFSTVFVSCSKSDDAQDAVVGIWTGTKTYGQLTVVLEANNSGRWSEYENYGSSYGGKSSSGYLTYQMLGNDRGIVTVVEQDSYSGTQYDNYYFIVQGNVMYLYEDGFGDDLEWTLYKQ